ncbi:MAG: cytochrome c1 [Burkholderiales bacterium]|nr:cytochrome c1 [Burkholderiales bacterium]
MNPVKSVRLALALLVLSFAAASWAAGGSVRLDRAQIDVGDPVSLQAGARSFVNYCLGCHGASLMRYNRLRDLGLSDSQIRDNLLFTSDKVGDLMAIGMTRQDGKAWFGVAPPDLSVIARSRGADWLYTYLRAFYRDASSPTGWNNLVFDRVAMPHVLWHLSGQAVLEVREFRSEGEARAAQLQSKAFSTIAEQGEGAHKRFLLRSMRVDVPGSLSPAKYDETVRDLVNYMVWMAEPAQQSRVKIGIAVILFLVVLLVLTWLLYRQYWKDIH